MNNRLRALIDKVDIMQEQIGNVSRETEILRRKQKEMLEIKNNNSTVTEGRMTLMDLLDRVWQRKESLSLRIDQ